MHQLKETENVKKEKKKDESQFHSVLNKTGNKIIEITIME